MATIDFQVNYSNAMVPGTETLSGSGLGFLELLPDLLYKLVLIKAAPLFQMVTEALLVDKQTT